MPALHFFDSSALVKRYVAEPGSLVVNGLLTNPDVRVLVSSLTPAEVSSAFVRRLPGKEASRLLAALDKDLAEEITIVPMDNDMVVDAIGLVRRHHIRGCDAIQLSAVLRLRQALIDGPDPDIELVFVCADNELNGAASKEDLATLNPATDTTDPA